MIGRRCTGTLRQFLKLATKNVMHSEFPGDFPCYIPIGGSLCIFVSFLEKDNVSVSGDQEINNRVQF